MNLAARSVAAVVMLVSGVLFCVIGSIAIGYVQRQGFEVILVVPLVPPAVTVFLLLVLTWTRLAGVLRSVARGLAFGCTLYLAVPIFYLSTNYDLIRRDGTAYWGLLQLSTVYIWPVALVGSAAVAAGGHYVWVAIGNRRSGDA